MFCKRDPRRVQPLVDYLTRRFRTSDFNSELSFDAIKIASFIRAFYEELGWQSVAWMDDILERYWPELHNEHDEVRLTLSYGLTLMVEHNSVHFLGSRIRSRRSRILK